MDNINPFISQESFKLRAIRIVGTQTSVDISYIPQDSVVSDMDGVQTVTGSYLVEKMEKVSVYNIPNITGALFGDDTTKAGRDLFLFIIYNLKRDEDFITLRHKEVCTRMHISRVTLTKAIANLVDISVIQRKSQSDYWVNPHYVFNGDKLKFFKKHYNEYIEEVAVVKRKPSQRGEKVN